MTDDLRNRVVQIIENLRRDSGVSSVEIADATLSEIGGVQNQLDEALNQLDSARHSVEVLECRITELSQKGKSDD